MSEEAQPKQPGKFMSGFRRSRADTPRLPKNEAKRQGNITTLAFQMLGGREGAIAFLNTANSGLDARPIDLAIASDEGYARVEQAIRRMAGSN